MPAIWAELALVVVLAQLYTASWALLGPQQPFRGSPLFNWYSCQPFQVFVFPVLCTIAWFRWRRTSRLPCKERSVARWLMAPYSDGEVGRPTEHVYFIILIGYFAKDIFIPMDLFFWIHHSICVAGCLYGLVADPPALLMLGSMLLELGSAAQAWHHYTPDSHTIFYGYIFVMTASNLIGVGEKRCL